MLLFSGSSFFSKVRTNWGEGGRTNWRVYPGRRRGCRKLVKGDYKVFFIVLDGVTYKMRVLFRVSREILRKLDVDSFLFYSSIMIIVGGKP